MTAASLQDRLTALANHAVTAKGGWRDNDAQVMLEAVDALNAIRPRELAIEQAIAHARAEIYHLKALIARASEELRMIEMKDSAALYDIGLRGELRQVGVVVAKEQS